jgi:CubicO group peptidase (beta-lactamase class C family)
MALAVAAALVACGPDVPENLGEAIDRIVLAEMEEGGLAGVAVGVARGLFVVHAAGYGFADVENEIPVTPETSFRVGSITKQFTAAAIVDLADDGALDLDDRLTQYLPEYPGYGPDVTISMLLSHTSGVKNYTTMEAWWETLAADMTPRRLIGVFEAQPFDFNPGIEFAYSNSGYVLLGWIAEQVTGQPYGGILNERLFVPLQLESTRYCDDRTLVRNRARGYAVTDGHLTNATYVSMSQAYAAGGVCSNVRDLIRWTRQLSRGGAVGREGWRAMSTPATLANGTPIEYGYGLALGYLEGHRRVSHVGGMLGFSGQIAHYEDDDLTIVVLSNTEGARTSAIEAEIARLMMGLGEQEVADILLAPEELDTYLGTYDLRLTRISITAQGGRLATEVTVPGLAGSHTLLYQGGHRFVSRSDPDVSVTFDVGVGRASSFVLSHKGITMRAARVADAG